MGVHTMNLTAQDGDQVLLAAWERWKAASSAIEREQRDDDDPVVMPHWQVLRKAEEVIFATRAVGTPGLLVKLRNALDALNLPTWASYALYAGDDASLIARCDELETAEACAIVEAMASLTAAVVSPAPTPFRLAHDRYMAARAAFTMSGDERDPVWAAASREWDEAADAMDAVTPTSWIEFADAFMVACDQGESGLGGRGLDSLVADVKRLREQSPVPTPTPFRLAADNYYAKRDFCHTFPEVGTMEPAEEAATESYLAATGIVDATPVSSWAEFGEAFLIATLDGDSYLSDANHEKLAEDARRLRDQSIGPASQAGMLALLSKIELFERAKTASLEFALQTLAPTENGYFRARKAIKEGQSPSPADVNHWFCLNAVTAQNRNLCDDHLDALEVVLLHPSETLPELLAKLKVIAAEDAWELTPAQDGIQADLKRFAGERT